MFVNINTLLFSGSSREKREPRERDFAVINNENRISSAGRVRFLVLALLRVLKLLEGLSSVSSLVPPPVAPFLRPFSPSLRPFVGMSDVRRGCTV